MHKNQYFTVGGGTHVCTHACPCTAQHIGICMWGQNKHTQKHYVGLTACPQRVAALRNARARAARHCFSHPDMPINLAGSGMLNV